MYFNIKCIGKLPGPTNEFERSLVFETGEFERLKFDCKNICYTRNIGEMPTSKGPFKFLGIFTYKHRTSVYLDGRFYLLRSAH